MPLLKAHLGGLFFFENAKNYLKFSLEVLKPKLYPLSEISSIPKDRVYINFKRIFNKY